jgi:hypothetical protein
MVKMHTQEVVHIPRPIIFPAVSNPVYVDMLATELNDMASEIPLNVVHGEEYSADTTLH